MADAGDLAPDADAVLRRRIAALENENAQLLSKVTKLPVHSYVREGRAIRRLVTLTEPISSLIEEYDRRLMVAGADFQLETVESTTEEVRTFRSYQKLILWCPSVRRLVQNNASGYEIASTCQELKRGADGARGDDANTLKHVVATWLNAQDPRPVPLLIPNDKEGRGFGHDSTGRLLCPVDYNWLDPMTRAAIREYHPNFLVTEDMWPGFLYAKGLYDPSHPSIGLFKGELLVRAFRCIFTSPSSARDEPEVNDTEGQQSAARNRAMHRARTRCNVAGLLKMRSVQPCAIAYISVQLRFALSNNTSWYLQDDGFDYQAFYHNIVDWFECPRTPARTQEIERLLLWWNRMVFGRQSAKAMRPQRVENLSVAASLA